MTNVYPVNKDDIPKNIFTSRVEYISWYTVGMRSINESLDENKHIGSGTLIDIEGHKGILTARHVIHCLKDSEKIGLNLSPKLHSYEIEKRYVEIINVQGDSIESKNLDLSVIIIPDNLLGSLRAYKSFFNISIKRNDILQNGVIINDGIWALCGFPGEFETSEEPQ